MIKTYRYKNITWIDLERPTTEDIRELSTVYKVDSAVASELLLPTPDPTVERFRDFIFVVLHFPAWKHTHSEKIQEVDFIIGKDYIVTARYDTMDALHKFSKMFSVREVLEKKKTEVTHAGTLFYFMMREIYGSLHDELASASDLLSDIEEKMFAGRERDMVRELSKLSRELLSFKHATVLHDDILDAYRSVALPFFGQGYGYEVSLIQKEYKETDRLAESYLESLAQLRDTNDSLLANKQNKIIQTLTVVIFITAIIQIFLALFAIDDIFRPIVGAPNDFWALLGVVVFIAIVLLGLFAAKEWL